MIELYRLDLWRRIRAGEIALEDLAALNSATLLCHCRPLPCHGDVLARAAAWAAGQLGRDLTVTIFDQGAALVPDIVTEAEEERILLRISQAPWMTDLSRRVQHYGFRYENVAVWHICCGDLASRGHDQNEPESPQHNVGHSPFLACS